MKSVGLENKNPRQNIDMEAFEKNIRSTNIPFTFFYRSSFSNFIATVLKLGGKY